MHSPSFIVTSILVTTIAYIIKGVLGFGPSLIIVPIFSMFIDIKQTVVIAALADVCSSGILLFSHRKKINWKYIKRIGIGLFSGTLLGVLIFKNTNALLMKKVLGAFIILYILFTYWSGKIGSKNNNLKGIWGVISGFAGGICGGIFNANGPPIVMYLNKVLKNKNYIRSTLMTLFLIDSIWRVSLFSIQGLLPIDTLKMFAVAVLPALLSGLWIAKKIDKNVRSRYYKDLVNGMLFVSSMNLILG